MPSPTEITVPQLARLIGTLAAPVIVDVCMDGDFATDPCLRPTAICHPFASLAELVPVLQDNRVVAQARS